MTFVSNHARLPCRDEGVRVEPREPAALARPRSCRSPPPHVLRPRKTWRLPPGSCALTTTPVSIARAESLSTAPPVASSASLATSHDAPRVDPALPPSPATSAQVRTRARVPAHQRRPCRPAAAGSFRPPSFASAPSPSFRHPMDPPRSAPSAGSPAPSAPASRPNWRRLPTHAARPGRDLAPCPDPPIIARLRARGAPHLVRACSRPHRRRDLHDTFESEGTPCRKIFRHAGKFSGIEPPFRWLGPSPRLARLLK